MALVLAIVPSLYIELGGYLNYSDLSRWEPHKRTIALILGPTASGLLACAAVLVLARARHRRTLGTTLAAVGAGAMIALVVLIISFSVLNHQNYFPPTSHNEEDGSPFVGLLQVEAA